MGTNCLVINNTATNSKATDQPSIGQETPMKNINEIALTEDATPFKLQDTRAIDDIGGEGFQEINDKENT